MPPLFSPGAHPPRFVAREYQPEPLPTRKRTYLPWLVVPLVIAVIAAGTFAIYAWPFSSPPGTTPIVTTPQARATSGPAQTESQRIVAELPSGMPSHFAFGVANAPGDIALLNSMRTHNGTDWDFRYTTLTGGVNNARNWTNSNGSGSDEAQRYLAESAANHFTPAFVYANLLSSTLSCTGCSAPQKTLATLSNTQLMAAYYADWQVLMHDVGQFGKPALIIVEPDVWGNMEQSLPVQTASISSIPASVASSGFPDAADYPNTAAGFAWTLLHMRDMYAPNAMLAISVSTWATGSDVATSTDTLLDPVQCAESTIAFLGSAGLTSGPKGVSRWDMLASDVADRDAGQDGGTWWDATNTLYPNFTRYLAFAQALHAAARRDIVMWRVPEGNQFFDTEDNTAYHTEDNRAQYILGHVTDFAQAGIVGVLFGAAPGNSSIDDAAHDGITNPAPVNGYGCNQCNVHESQYPDDDGGYLRLFVGAYYQQGALQLSSPTAWHPREPANPGATATPVPAGACVGIPVATIGQISASPTPVAAGQTVTFTVHITMSCTTTALVDVEIVSSSARIADATVNNVSFTAQSARAITASTTIPAGTPAGDYLVTVGVFHDGWGTLYGWNGQATVIRVS